MFLGFLFRLGQRFSLGALKSSNGSPFWTVLCSGVEVNLENGVRKRIIFNHKDNDILAILEFIHAARFYPCWIKIMTHHAGLNLIATHCINHPTMAQSLLHPALGLLFHTILTLAILRVYAIKSTTQEMVSLPHPGLEA